MTLRQTNDGECRVNFRSAGEHIADYAGSLDDAVATGRAMAECLNKWMTPPEGKAWPTCEQCGSRKMTVQNLTEPHAGTNPLDEI